MYNLIVNSSHSANPNNNTYNYQFRQGSFEIPPDSEAMISSIQIPYSFYNITQRYNNNVFRFYWPTATNTYSMYTFTIEDGFYTMAAMNARLQQFFIDNKLYIVDASGNNFYYMSFATNSVAYANQVIARVVPTSQPVGTTAPPAPPTGGPATFPGFPTVARTPYLEILSTNNFGRYIGLTPGTYPATPVSQTTNYSVLSNITPLTTNVNSLVIKCSLVNNGVSSVASDVIDAFAIGSSTISTFGANLSWQNGIEKFVNITPGKYNNIIFSIVDQNLNEVILLDNNILISLLIRKKKIS
jgi:hypothetical protein